MQDSHDSSAFAKRVKKHVIGKRHRFVAIAPLGFEDTLAWELQNILDSETLEESAIPHVTADGKVEFTAKITVAWKVVAYSRVANRVLMEIASFKAENFGQLEKHTAEIPWELFLDESGFNLDERGAEIVLHTSCKHSRLYHSGAIEERVLKIIREKLSAQFQKNSNSQPQQSANCHPRLDRESGMGVEQHLYISLVDDRCTLLLDLAGEELYKRGHNRFVAEAPLKETIAAAMIFESMRLTANHPLTTIIDPMAGSGTFSLEAAYIANGLIPGKCRDFALKHQPAFKEGTWRYILDEIYETSHFSGLVELSSMRRTAVSGMLPKSIAIVTSDISERAIEIIRHNAEISPIPEGSITPKIRDFFSYKPEDIPENTLILLNPPYGKRLDADAPALFAKIGNFLQKTLFDQASKKNIHVAIMVPKKLCRERFLEACPTMNPQKNFSVIEKSTSHGGINLSLFFI